jgi:YfiR/HmsC-like
MERLKRTKIIPATVILLALLSAPLQAAAPPQSEYGLKSAFLYNFCRFIDWPDSAFASSNEPLIIGIMGDDPFGSLLNDAIRGKKYHSRPIRIDHYRIPAEIRRCHLLFISHVNAGRLEPILATVAGKTVLTVSETEDFLNRGGMITLTSEQNRVRLRINMAALQSINLSVSSKLLRVAEIKP